MSAATKPGRFEVTRNEFVSLLAQCVRDDTISPGTNERVLAAADQLVAAAVAAERHACAMICHKAMTTYAWAEQGAATCMRLISERDNVPTNAKPVKEGP